MVGGHADRLSLRAPGRTLLLAVALATSVLLVLSGCESDEIVAPPAQNPQHIAVRYLLVGFEGSVPGQVITRTKAQAESLALSLHVRATGGEDFGDLTETYSDSPARDTIAVANYGVTPGTGEYPRTTLVRGFGDVAFAIAVDSVGLAPYDSATSPFGWFLIHRVE